MPKDLQHFQDVINADKKPIGKHKGRFNAPTTKEVEILVIEQQFKNRDIVLQSRVDKLIRICEIHHAYDAVQYPLIFCRGEDGYCINNPPCDPKTRTSKKMTVSAADFLNYETRW